MEKIARACVRCGVVFSGVRCPACKNARKAAYQAANPEKVNAYQSAYREANPEKMRVQDARADAKKKLNREYESFMIWLPLWLETQSTESPP